MWRGSLAPGMVWGRVRECGRILHPLEILSVCLHLLLFAQLLAGERGGGEEGRRGERGGGEEGRRGERGGGEERGEGRRGGGEEGRREEGKRGGEGRGEEGKRGGGEEGRREEGRGRESEGGGREFHDRQAARQVAS